jgi:hypothetical protein
MAVLPALIEKRERAGLVLAYVSLPFKNFILVLRGK